MVPAQLVDHDEKRIAQRIACLSHRDSVSGSAIESAVLNCGPMV
jgi:hypothetical protein